MFGLVPAVYYST